MCYVEPNNYMYISLFSRNKQNYKSYKITAVLEQ